MAGEYAAPGGRRNSSAQLLEELEALSHSLYTAHTSNRRTASLALPRTSIPPILTDEVVPTKPVEKPITKSRRRLSLSPWRSRPKLEDETLSGDQRSPTKISMLNSPKSKQFDEQNQDEKKGIWKWKPIRAISHIGKQKLSCLFSVEVVAAQGLPASMNGLRLSVCVRKKETKDGAVQTMPSRVSQGAADFEETLFVKCHVYGNSGNGKQMKFEPRPFWIYLFAVDAGELDFGKKSVDLTNLIQESMEKSFEGARIRQWDVSFNLSGKAKGGELVLKLGFQIMEKDGGTMIYNQMEPLKTNKSSRFLSSSFARKQSKTSFSFPSPRMSGRSEAVWSPLDTGRSVADLRGIDDLNLDEPAPAPAPQTSKKEMDDLDLPDFEVVDKGVEISEEAADEERESEGISEGKSASSEVVKEILVDKLHLARLSELDSLAKKIKALESMMGDDKSIKGDEETDSQRLDADEDAVTREFLQLLEGEEEDEFKLDPSDIKPPLQLDEAKFSASADDETKVYLPDLGKGLGCVVQTRDGGYLAAMNPLDTAVLRKDMPKLAMQISKPLVLPSDKSISGFELLQRMVGDGVEELSSRILSLMPMDDLMGKTTEQIAFEGIASAIIQGRSKEGASSSAARTIAAVKTMAAAMSTGRKERISSGIWNVNENPLTAEEILAFSLQKIESMSIDSLKVQAEMPEEEAPFCVSPVTGRDQDYPLTSSVPLDDWIKNYGLNSSETALGDPAALTLAVVVQLRDPIRRYEAVGGPMIAIIQAASPDAIKTNDLDEDKRFKTASLHVAGLKIRTVRRKNAWDTEKQRLTAMQWLVAFGLMKAGKRGKQAPAKGQDLLWSMSSRVMADMWLKAMRNPDVKFAK